MSYDVLIHLGDDPYEPPDDLLDVETLVRAFDSFPPFANAGITWADERWHDDPRFAGLMLFLANHAPAESDDGTFNYASGEAQVCRVSIASPDAAGVAFVRRLARHLASAWREHVRPSGGLIANAGDVAPLNVARRPRRSRSGRWSGATPAEHVAGRHG